MPVIPGNTNFLVYAQYLPYFPRGGDDAIAYGKACYAYFQIVYKILTHICQRTSFISTNADQFC
ncbi:MAG: hypothetical protein RMY30_038585 [Nostoc sp. CmiSLP01]|nr:hypothetical protein [Nostoc sp. CmiSLP01]MDZ8287547.1 hypothetical protein [Nostoc sp. ChiSLP01]